MKRTTGTYAISTTLGKPVRAFVPYPLPPANPALTAEAYADLNHQAELALARLRVRQKLETTFPTATAAVQVLEDLGIVTEMTGQKKNRSYSYQPYIELLSR